MYRSRASGSACGSMAGGAGLRYWRGHQTTDHGGESRVGGVVVGRGSLGNESPSPSGGMAGAAAADGRVRWRQPFRWRHCLAGRLRERESQSERQHGAGLAAAVGGDGERRGTQVLVGQRAATADSDGARRPGQMPEGADSGH
jgi:hypothetical protein